MLDESVEQALEERLAKRMQEANTHVLKTIAKTLSKIGAITPSQATKLVNVLKFGGNYNKIVKALKQYTNLNDKDIDKIFKNVAKQNEMFAKQFYDYRNIPMTPYEKNKELQAQVNAIAKATKGEMGNISDTWGFQKIVDGKRINTPLSQVYQDVIDRGVYAISQGKESFNQETRRIINELSRSGLRKIDFDSGYSRRVDSQVRMNLKDGIRALNNTMFQQFGEEFGADGVEISVHDRPAPDHQEVQGRQFSNEEFEKFQTDQDCVDYKGKKFPSVSVETKHDRRSIGQYNCYHDIFPIILGLTKPRYTDEELQAIIDDANKKITFEGKEYTMYEATQLQRKLETEVRKEKDKYVMARQLGDDGEDEMLEAEKNIRLLEKKYFNLSKESGLDTDVERLWVNGYKYNKLTQEQENKLETLEKQAKIGNEKKKDEQLTTSIPQKAEFIEPPIELNEVKDNKFYHSSKIFNKSKEVLDLTNNENINIYNATDKLNITIYERPNIKKAKYSRTNKKITTTSVVPNNLDPQATLWHEMGHALDNYKGKDGYASNNVDLRTAMYDYYNDNKKIPQNVVDYFNNLQEDVYNEFKAKNDYDDYYKNYIKIKQQEGASEYNLNIYKDRWNNNREEYDRMVKREYNWNMRAYYQARKREDMKYAELLNFSDMFSAISKGEYNDFCGMWGYHSKSYFNDRAENPTTELFANFVSLKMTGQKDHLDFFKKECPKIYDELEKIYIEIGDELSAK